MEVIFNTMRHDVDDVEKLEKEIEKRAKGRVFLTASEVAKMLGISHSAVCYYCQKGYIFAVKTREKNGKWLIPKTSLIEFFLRSNTFEKM